jgi:prolyl-tRNA synthetase
VLFDDREVSAGVKFADADLIGIPHRLLISQKTLQQDAVEYKKRSGKEAELIKLTDAPSRFTS